MLLGHRYYDASVGRFISEDPIQAGDNWYAYCDNNPLKAIDPSGLAPPLSSPTTPHGAAEVASIAEEAAGAGPKPVFPAKPVGDIVKLLPKTGPWTSAFGKIIGWGSKAAGAIKLGKEITSEYINKMHDSGLTSH